MLPAPWSPVQDAPSGTLEELLLRIQQGAPVRPLGGGRLARLGRFLRALGHPAPRVVALADALPHLFPKVRPAAAFEAYARETGKPAPEFRPLAGNLAVSLLVDLPNQDLDVTPAQLQIWNADFDTLLQRARGNLLARGGERPFQAVRDGCWRSPWRDDLDGSRILLPGSLRGVRVKGDLVAVLAGRDTLLVTGSEDPEGLDWALDAALQHLLEDPDALDATPLRFRNYGWEPLRLPDGHPAAALLERLERRRPGSREVLPVPVRAA